LQVIALQGAAVVVAAVVGGAAAVFSIVSSFPPDASRKGHGYKYQKNVAKSFLFFI